MKTEEQSDQLDRIAIIGLAGRFPGAASIDQFWENLSRGVESIRSFSAAELLAAGEDPSLMNSSAYVKASAVLDGVELFDADFFGFSPREAEVTDPQHRIFLECSWEALENAGYDPDQYRGRIGVFAGAGLHCYYQHNLASNPHLVKVLGDLPRFIAIEKDFVSTRVSYRLNLKGPSLSIQTACSTSLVSVHLGCQSLLNGESDMVLAGGVSIKLPTISGYLYQEGSILSPDGHCRAFDASAGGTVFGSGVGIVVLKRLADAQEDGDHIRAVIRGSCINNDGALKVGYTAPSVDGQSRLITEAHAIAGLTADEVSYVETHGTGTTLGDPIEVMALTKAFRATTPNKNFCAIGSLKTNVGHLDAAAGVAGLIKVVLSLENGKLPPSLNFSQPNPAIDFANSPFYVQSALSDWKPANCRRIAGVSSFGIGGTNAHVIVEEAAPLGDSSYSTRWQLLPISARSPKALEKATDQLVSYLKSHGELNFADVAFTLQQGRRSFPYRRIIAAADTGDAIDLLEGRSSTRVHSAKVFDGDADITFMFPAQGAQHVNMGRDLYDTEPLFKREVDRCASYLEPILGIDLRNTLYPSGINSTESTERLKQTRITQPAVFTINYALAQLWMSWGVTPSAMVGHSLGEYVAATLSGVFDLESALALVAERARLMQQLPTGSMLVVYLPENDLAKWLPEDISLAAVNAPGVSVVSGPTVTIEHLSSTLRDAQVEVQPLLTSHAFHSAMMQPMIARFEEEVAKTERHPPQVPFVSTLTGTWITAEQAMDPNYWARQTRHGVRFSSAVVELMRRRNNVLLEVGPGNSLSALAKLHLSQDSQCKIVNSLPHAKEGRSDIDTMFTALGDLWTAGVSIDWKLLHSSGQRHRVPLPTYPFERKRFWIELRSQSSSLTDTPGAAFLQACNIPEPGNLPDLSIRATDNEVASAGKTNNRPNLKTQYVPPRHKIEIILSELWGNVLGVSEIGIDDNFFELGGQSLMAVTLVSEIGRALGRRFSLGSLIGAPTIRQFAKLIDKQQPQRESSKLIDAEIIAQQVRTFIVETYLGGQPSGLKNDDSLLKNKVVDQMAFLQIAAFIEETHGIVMRDEDLTCANLDSIKSVCAYIERRLNAATGAGFPALQVCSRDTETIQ